MEINIPFGLQDYKTVYRLMCWISILCECVRVVSTTTKGETQNLLKSLGAPRGFMSQSKLGCAAVFGYWGQLCFLPCWLKNNAWESGPQDNVAPEHWLHARWSGKIHFMKVSANTINTVIKKNYSRLHCLKSILINKLSKCINLFLLGMIKQKLIDLSSFTWCSTT